MNTCIHCGLENEAERTFCSDCGTRLPSQPAAEPPKLTPLVIAPIIPTPPTPEPPKLAPLVIVPIISAPHAPELPKLTPLVAPLVAPPPAAQPKAPPAIIAPIRPDEPSAPGATAPPISAPVQKLEKKKVPAERGFLSVLVRELVLMAALGAILAAVIQMAREPQGVPAAASASTAAAQEAITTLRSSGESVRAISWTINQSAVNEFLATTIQMDSSAVTGGARFERAFVILNAGSLDLGIEQKLFERSLFFLLNVTPEPTDAGLGARVTGGAIGRLPIHPRLLPVFMRFFDQTIAGLAQPLELLRGVKSAAVKPGDVTLQWAGSKSH